MKVYVVKAVKHNNIIDGYSYIVGVYQTEQLARKMAKSEENFRGTKYTCYIFPFILDNRTLTEQEIETI